MLAVLPKDHTLTKMDVIPLHLLGEEPFILLEEGHYYEPLESFRSIGITPQVKYTIHDDYTIMTMVEAGLGVSILAELILHQTMYCLALRPTDPPVTRTIAVAYKDKSVLSMASKHFIQCVYSRINALP